MDEIGYSNNIFNKTPNTTSINEIHLKTLLNNDYLIDLLTIFNNIDVDDNIIFMQLYSDQSYPVFKINKNIINVNNMSWISKWCKASPMQGKLDVSDDTTFSKLIVKIRLPNHEEKYDDIFKKDIIYFTIELQPKNATMFIRFYIKNEAYMSVEKFEEIIYYTNMFIERCSNLNIYTIPIEYLQNANINSQRYLKLLGDIDNDTTINFYSAINFINICIQDYWDVYDHGKQIPRSLDTMNKLLYWLLNNFEINNNMFNILIASNQIINNQIPLIYRFNDNYIAHNKELIEKTIIKYLKKAKMSFTAYNDMINNSVILSYLSKIYPKIFSDVSYMWLERVNKTTMTLNNYFNSESISQMIQQISNLFGVTINVGLNNINILGILNVDMMYMIETSLEFIIEEFIKFLQNPNNITKYNQDAMKLHEDINNQSFVYIEEEVNFDDLVIEDSITNDVENVIEEDEQVEKTYIEEQVGINQETYAINPNNFNVYEGYKGDDVDKLQMIKDSFLEFEREIMADEIDTIRKKGEAKIQSALTRLKKFDKMIEMNTDFAKECQSDKKPIILTIDEIDKLRDQLTSGQGKLTPYGEYLQFIFENAKKYDNPYYYYICCMIFDFHERKIVNPYCTYAIMNPKLESVYYIPFKSANDLFITERWYPSGDSYIHRYDPSKVVQKLDKLYYPDPSDNDKLVEMIKIFPKVSRFHCIDFNASKNYVELPYKFIPDIVNKNGLPCCFSKTQVIPKTPSNYNNSLNANNETYRKYKLTGYMDFYNGCMNNSIIFDGVNRFVQLPEDLNILFNNQSVYKDKYMRDEWCRRLVFEGYFVNIFDFLITNNNSVTIHHSNNNMSIYLLPKVPLITFMVNKLTDDMFMTMRNGLIRFMFHTKEEFLKYCFDNYFTIDEELLWELISEIFDINIFIIKKINKKYTKNEIIPEQYLFEFPQGYDLDKLYRHPRSMFIYKYSNTKSEMIYNLIDRVKISDKASAVNIKNFNPFIPSDYSFIKTIIQTMKDTNKQIFFDQNIKSHTPTAKEFIEHVKLHIIGQTRTHNLEYTDNVIFNLPNGNTAILPVYPTTLLPDSIPVLKIKYPLYTRKVVNDIINIVNNNKDVDETWYYPRAAITNDRSVTGYIFDKNIHMYFRPITYKTEITPQSLKDPTIQIVKQYFKSNNSLIALENRSKIDIDRDEYISNKNLMKSIIFSIEYMLSIGLNANWRNELIKYFSMDSNMHWNEIGNYLYNFVEKFIDVNVIIDKNKKYKVNTSNVNISNIISNIDDNIVTTYKGSTIQNCYTANTKEECNKIPMCKWNNIDDMCMVCFNDEKLKNNVINYIVNELLSSFNTIRYKIMYGASFSTEPKVIQNYHPEKQIVINASNAISAIETLNNIIRGEKISSLAENMKIVYTLTHNFNTIQKQQVDVILRSLTNEINPEVLFSIKLPCIDNVYMVNMYNNSNDFWFTTMFQTAQRSGIATIPKFRQELSDILVKNKYIRAEKSGEYIYFSRMMSKFFEVYMQHLRKPFVNDNNYSTVFDHVIDIFRSKSYLPSYLDFAALMMAPWNDYNIAIIHVDATFEEFSKRTYNITELPFDIYDYNSNDLTLLKHMKYKSLPRNTTEDNISDAKFYKHRTKYLVYLELEYNNRFIYKSVIKYNPAINFQSFEFDRSEIQCLIDHTYHKQANAHLMYGNIPQQIYMYGLPQSGDPDIENVDY